MFTASIWSLKILPRGQNVFSNVLWKAVALGLSQQHNKSAWHDGIGKSQFLLQFKSHALREALNLFIQKCPQMFARVSGKHFACHSFLPFASVLSHPRPLLNHSVYAKVSKILRLVTLTTYLSWSIHGRQLLQARHYQGIFVPIVSTPCSNFTISKIFTFFEIKTW